MQGFSYTSAFIVAGAVALVLALSILVSPLLGIAIALLEVAAYLVAGTAPKRRPRRDARDPNVAAPTPDPEVDRRSAESFPASDPPATY